MARAAAEYARPKRKAAGGGAAGGVTRALAEAAWAEADVALAQALVELDALQRVRSPQRRAEILALLSQALQRAARKRGLARIGERGAAERFDAQRHELDAPGGRPPRRVRVVASGFARGPEILIKARVRKPPVTRA